MFVFIALSSKNVTMTMVTYTVPHLGMQNHPFILCTLSLLSILSYVFYSFLSFYKSIMRTYYGLLTGSIYLTHITTDHNFDLAEAGIEPVVALYHLRYKILYWLIGLNNTGNTVETTRVLLND